MARELIEDADDLEKNTKEERTDIEMVTTTEEDSSSHSSCINKKKLPQKDKEQLSNMSLNTAAAIALHNFPEGLATFVATVKNPSVGAILAVGIALHNVPEGLCVSLPIYYATGNRWKAFAWGLLSGISEPLAAFLGWVILATFVSDMMYAIMFGLVGGMMVVISVKELLPTAHRYDREDTVVTNMFIAGMAIMAGSLVLFAQL